MTHLLANPAQLGSIIAPTMSRADARAALFRGGWEFIDGGSFSSVWRSPNGDRVIKVTKADAGSLATVEASFASSSKHLPRIYGVVQLANGGFAVEVELLKPIRAHEWKAHRQAIGYIENSALEPLDDELRAAAEALHAAVRRHPVSWDIHDGNVMMRDDGETRTLVLTDLLYEPEQFYRGAAGQSGTKHDAASVAITCGDDPIDQLMLPVYDVAGAKGVVHAE